MDCTANFYAPSTVPEYVYVFSFIFTGIAWLCLIIFPRQSWANFWFAGVWGPVILGLVYTFVLFYYFFQPYTVGAYTFTRSNPLHFFTLQGLRCLFLKDGVLLAGFLDLLILPLMVGAWMTRKAAQIRMPYIYLLPCLLLTFGAPGTGVVLFALFVATGGRWSQLARFDGQPPVNVSPVFARSDN